MPPGTTAPTAPDVALDPVAVLAGVMARDGSELSATETVESELARADHLGVLGGIWDDLVRRAQRDRFEAALRDALPAGLAGAALDDPACAWLWRTLRETETCGLDGGQVLREAIGARNLTGARDVARVLDSRVRRRLKDARPQPPGPWSERVPDTGSAEVSRYLRELADAMDDRTRRLGEHAALTLPLWAGQALGPLPADPAGWLGWEHRAGVIAAYRERYGHDHPGDPIGAEPGRTSPEARAGWHGALAALGRIDGIDLRHLSDGDLWLRRGTYERETAWAPPHAAADLKLARTAGRDAHVNALRAEHETRAARRRRAAARHAELARRWRAVAAKAAAEEQLLAAVQDTHRRWEQVSESTRRIAIAADTELRRRRPGTRIAPLRPHPAEATAGRLRQPEAERLAARGLTPETAGEAIPPELHQLHQRAATVQYRLDELSSLRLPAGEHDELSPCLAWPEHVRGRRDAVLQPAHREIEPSSDVQAAHASRTDAGEPEREQEREAE